jgi:hypothetical protein
LDSLTLDKTVFKDWNDIRKVIHTLKPVKAGLSRWPTGLSVRPSAGGQQDNAYAAFKLPHDDQA